MNKQQRIAINNACYFGFETIQPHFAYLSSPFVSIVLTVNSGYE
jgi:uncharacterized membrane protein (GlpM family)